MLTLLVELYISITQSSVSLCIATILNIYFSIKSMDETFITCHSLFVKLHSDAKFSKHCLFPKVLYFFCDMLKTSIFQIYFYIYFFALITEKMAIE